MALTSTDETDLLLPLYQGVHEEPRFSTFLHRVMRRTRAEYVGLVVRGDRNPDANATVFFAGQDLHGMARERGIEELYMLEGIHHSSLRPYRVYDVSEFVDHDPDYKAKRERGIEQLGIIDERVVRVFGEDGISAWLVLARGKACTASDSALLSSLAPYVATALKSLNLAERRNLETALSNEGLGMSGIGWILFDEDARLLMIEPGTQRRLAQVTGAEPKVGERLRNIGVEAERILAESATRFANDASSEPGAVLLNEEPRADALLISAKSGPGSPLMPVPAMVAYVRFEREGAAGRAARLARLFDLPPREAELAIALSDGLSIAEAAEAMNLTIETTRN